MDAWDGVNQFWTGGEDDQGGTWDSKVVPGGPPWTNVGRTSFHPQGVIEGVVESPQMAVRRWVSDVDGKLGLVGYFHNTMRMETEPIVASFLTTRRLLHYIPMGHGKTSTCF